MENSLEYISVQLQEVREKIAQAEKVNHRQPGAVKLLAVSKTFPNEAILAAYAAGQRAFGENKVAELEAKATVLPGDIQWHLIGHLQSNKVARAVRYASWIHSVDSIHLAKEIEKQASKHNIIQECYVQIKISNDENKTGLPIEDAILFLKECEAFPHIKITGLMCVASNTEEESIVINEFDQMNELFKLVKKMYPDMHYLSMGMSDDYLLALKHGSNTIRIGSSIFGKRNYQI